MGFRLEAVAVWITYKLFAFLPIDAASALGGWIGRTIGYHLPVTRHARRNLTRVFPAWSDSEREAVIKRMWDNVGRTVGEYPHIPELTYGPGARVEIEGMEHNACGGTHVASTGVIGSILLRRTEKVKQGIRVEFCCGLRAIAAARRDFDLLRQTGSLLSVGAPDVPSRVEKLLQDAKAAAKELKVLKKAAEPAPRMHNPER